MRKTIAAATIAVGGLGVLGLGATAIAGAQDDTGADTEEAEERSGSSWVQDALGGLVDDGTITQDQADAVEGALDEARPAHGPGGHGRPGGIGHRGWFGGDASALTESLGVDEDTLRQALRDGTTIAELAEQEGVEVQDVVDALVAAQQQRLDEAVADGDLTQEDADALREGAEDRVTAFVNGERPGPEDLPDVEGLPFGGHGRGGGPGGWGPHGDGSGDDGSGDADGSGDGSGDDGTTDGTSAEGTST